VVRCEQDPSEYHDVAAAHPQIVAALLKRIDSLRSTAFMPRRCVGCDDGFGGIACSGIVKGNCADKRACDYVVQHYNGFWGPWVDVPAEASVARPLV
jgi:hypothetical protein